MIDKIQNYEKKLFFDSGRPTRDADMKTSLSEETDARIHNDQRLKKIIHLLRNRLNEKVLKTM